MTDPLSTLPEMSSEQAARLFKCLSEGIRLRLVALLADEELNVNELKEILDVPQSTLSRHLAVLKESELLCARRQGTWVYYRMARPKAGLECRSDVVNLVRGLLAGDPLGAEDRARRASVLEARRLQVQTYFESEGHTWDEFHRAVADPAVKPLLVSRVVPEGLVFVDVGCGSGYLLDQLAAAASRVIAVDNARAQLARARAFAESAGITNVEFRDGDLAALPIEDGVADAVFAHLTLHHASRPEAAVREMVRVLKPGGSAVISDFVAHEETWLQAEHADLWLGFHPDDAAAWCRDAGLVQLRVEERPYALPRIKSSGHSAAGLSLFVLCGRKPLSP